MRFRHALVIHAVLWGLGCPDPKKLTPDGGDEGENPDPVCANGFCVSQIIPLPVVARASGDPRVEPSQRIAAALGPNGQVGIAYFSQVGTEDYDVRYLEWTNGSVSFDERIRTVTAIYGISLAFQSNGQPAVSYLGGDAASYASVDWIENDAEVAYRNGPGSWRTEMVVRDSGEASAGIAVSDNGWLVGLHSALGFSGTTAFLAYRDCHFGQSSFGDYTKSDLEVAVGATGAWAHNPVFVGGNGTNGWGGHTQMVMVDGQPALVSDQIMNVSDGTGQNAVFTRRASNGTWSAPKQVLAIGDTQSGPSMAYDSRSGFVVAAVDETSDALQFTSSTNGTTWTSAYTVFQSGTGGWYPSIAVDPQYGDPAIAFFVCSRRTGASVDGCTADEVELRLAERAAGVWRERTVAATEAYLPKLLFTSAGKRLIVFQPLRTGSLRIAVEQ